MAWAKSLAGAAACLRFLCADAIAPDRIGDGISGTCESEPALRLRCMAATASSIEPPIIGSTVSPPKQGSTAHQQALLPSSQCPVVLAEAGSIPTQLKLREMRCGQDSGRASVRVPVVNEDFILLVRTMISHVLWSYHSLDYTMISLLFHLLWSYRRHVLLHGLLGLLTSSRHAYLLQSVTDTARTRRSTHTQHGLPGAGCGALTNITAAA